MVIQIFTDSSGIALAKYAAAIRTVFAINASNLVHAATGSSVRRLTRFRICLLIGASNRESNKPGDGQFKRRREAAIYAIAEQGGGALHCKDAGRGSNNFSPVRIMSPKGARLLELKSASAEVCS